MSSEEDLPYIEMFTCFHCAKSIHSNESYFEIIKYDIPYKGKENRKQFHEDCFEEIAGAKYCR